MLAKIAVEKAAFGFDRLFEYNIPENLMPVCERGKRAMVPFGKGNTKRQGMIFEISESPEKTDVTLKDIESIPDERPVLSDDLLGLARYLSFTCFCSMYDSVKAMLPPGILYKSEKRYFYLSGDGAGENEREILGFLKRRKKGATVNDIMKALNIPSGEILPIMEQRSLIRSEEITSRKTGDETVKMARLADDIPVKRKISQRQQEVMDFLYDSPGAGIKEIEYYTGASKSVLDTMEKNGIIEYFEAESFRTPLKDEYEHRDPDDLILSPEQQSAFEGIKRLCDAGKQETALLYGVTGSGKTQVFIKLIESEINRGKQVILMVPEISLTPQMLGKFMSYFGDRVAVVHSALSQGERLDEWKRIASGRASIVIGTRSAVFAPVKNPGLIIMDEEQEPSYKSDRSPRFDARDTAIERAKYFNIPVLLASATPSVESYYRAEKGKYRLFKMKERYGGATLPKSILVDMDDEIRSGNTGILSEALHDEIEYNLKNREQTILLMNRRGYNTVLRCANCGETVSCPRCSIPLTYHKANGRLMCHYCGYSMVPKDTCSVCGSRYVMYQGCGTQKVEEELNRLFPDARVLRMDLDTTMAKYSHERAFNDFAEGRYDIMIGTQMVAKGLDFPNVTLVGVLAADMSLLSGDYKSFERTFGLLTQVIGRGGRSEKKGRAYIQTHNPEHPVIVKSCGQNYELFYRDEIINRKLLLYPPFCRMGSVMFSCERENDARNAAKRFSGLFEEKIRDKNIPIRILGPTPSRVFRMAGEYRWKIIVKYRPDKIFYETMRDALSDFSKDKNFKDIKVTADPYDVK